MIAGKLTCPHCNGTIELSTTKAPAQQAQRRTAPSGNVSDEVGRLLDEIHDNMMMGTRLSEKEEVFYQETRERYDKWVDRGGIMMSDRQMAFLRSVAAKAGVD